VLAGSRGARLKSADENAGRGYDDLYKAFDSDLMRRLRAEAYGSDIGQHSWVTETDLREDIAALGLTRASAVLDLGCGPGGPLTYIASKIGCRAVGADCSASAITAGRSRIASMGLADRVSLHEWDLDEPIPVADRSFDAVLSLDVMLHLRDRGAVFREVARVLRPQGRFLFTDAGVVTGVVTEDEARRRAIHGYTRLEPAGLNERLIQESGLALLRAEDRTDGLLKNATGRLAARLAHRTELEHHEGAAFFDREQAYLETVITLANRGALARRMYLVEVPEGAR
jgi:SAM-dependent methyltransferase